jgi:hypothetical protein
MFIGRDRLLRDPGTLWHIVVGERIVNTGHLPRADPFSFPCAGKPWIAQWWLGEVVLAMVHRLCHFDGLLLLAATVLAFLYSWVASRLIRGGFHWLLASFTLALAIAASSYHFHPRPHLATIVFLGTTFAWLCDFEAGRLPLRRLFWLVPSYVVWTNIHGGMVGGVVTLALFAVGRLVLQRGARERSSRNREALGFGVLIVLCGLTALINPYGLVLPRTWFALLTSPALPRLIDEHRPLLTQRTGLMVLPLVGLYVLVWLGTLPRRPTVTSLIPFFWLAMAFSRIRNGPLFAITAVIALGDLFPHSCWARWLVHRGSDLFKFPETTGAEPAVGGWASQGGWRLAIVPLMIVLTALGLQAGGVRVPVIGSGWARLDPAYWPVDLLPELKAYERSVPEGTPIFNEMNLGGFLIYYTPGLRVFVDDRCELYGDAGILAVADAARQNPWRVDAWARQYRFDHALVQNSSGFARYLSTAPDWSPTAVSDSFTLYRRATARGEAPDPRSMDVE